MSPARWIGWGFFSLETGLTMKPTMRMLSDQEEEQIIAEATALLQDPGVVIDHPETLTLLAESGARINWTENRACLPADLITQALASCPPAFALYDLHGREAVHYGGQRTYFNPGSAALQVLDSKTRRIRPANTADLAAFVQIVEGLPQIDAHSTALVPGEVPEAVQDLYRLYVTLTYQTKPIVTGVFHPSSWQAMKEMLQVAAGGSRQLREKPLAIFDICPASPLRWSCTSAQNLLDNTREGIPIQIIPMPMAGATAPATLAGTLVQHTAECLSGIVLSQLAQTGAPVVWGGSPAVFDMKNSAAPMGSAGTWLLAAAYAQIGRSLGLPTQGYLGLSDAKLVDAQAGMESSAGALVGALAGFSMISGAGMLAYQNCQSPEKLILDAEIIGQIQGFAEGIQFREDPFGLDLIRAVGAGGDFISLDHTYRWFREEGYYPSGVIDRLGWEDWLHRGSQDAWDRARTRVEQLRSTYQGPALPAPARQELHRITSLAARQAGLDDLPLLPA